MHFINSKQEWNCSLDLLLTSLGLQTNWTDEPALKRNSFICRGLIIIVRIMLKEIGYRRSGRWKTDNKFFKVFYWFFNGWAFSFFSVFPESPELTFKNKALGSSQLFPIFCVQSWHGLKLSAGTRVGWKFSVFHLWHDSRWFWSQGGSSGLGLKRHIWVCEWMFNSHWL